jgi:hypothetical protein
MPALQAQILYESRPVCQKNVISMVSILDFCKRKYWALVMTLRSIACSDISSLGHIEIPKTHPQLQHNQENWDCLDNSG